jgi:HK97 family phage major capsid protein
MRLRAFPGHGADVDTKYERSGQWLLATIYNSDRAKIWCSTNNVPLRKAMGEGINSNGGFVVPQELSKAILDIREYYGAFRRRARLVPMASDNTSVARHTGGASSAFFTAENTAASETTLSLDKIELTARKIGSLVRISSEVEEDAASDMVDFVTNEIGYAFAQKEDDCAFNGDGTSAYGGMRGIGTIVLDGNHASAKVTAASGHNTFLTLDQTDLANLISAVQASSIPNASWFCSQTAFAQTFCRLAGTANGFLETRMVDGIQTPCYLGFPVILTQKLPLISTSLTGKVMMVFGDMYMAGVLGQRRAITLARSDDRYLDQDEIGVLGTQRFHTVIHDVGDNSNVGAVAALAAP